jgi:hypothetical protein
MSTTSELIIPNPILENRFWAKVQKTETCWLWLAAVNKKKLGYGLIKVDGKMLTANRVAWVLTRGPIPDGMCVLHHCDNSTCVNPDHLFLGSQIDNIKDMWQKRRGRHGSAHPNARLMEQDVREVKMKWLFGMTQAALAREFDVSRRTIQRILIGTSWERSR